MREVEAYDMRLLKGDCLEVMRTIPDKSVDMILCDLPYGVTAHKADVIIPLEPLWKDYKRIIKDNGVIALFAQGSFYIDLVNSNRRMFKYDLVWDKMIPTGFLNAKRMPMRRHEQIAVFYKKAPVYHPQFIRGKKSHGKGTKFKWSGVENNNYGEYKPIDTRKDSENKYPVSVIPVQKVHPSVTLHRNEKPVDLLEYLIRMYTNTGDVVLDNCMGSGSTGVACLKSGRRFIGIEINEEYFDIAKNRIVGGNE